MSSGWGEIISTRSYDEYPAILSILLINIQFCEFGC
jgi:hypothetical protein